VTEHHQPVDAKLRAYVLAVVDQHLVCQRLVVAQRIRPEYAPRVEADQT